MIGLDTNVLARYYIDDAVDDQSQRQRVAARRLIESGQSLMVSKTVILELEWVMRGYYGFSRSHITVEDRAVVQQALSNAAAGIDFADALHHASYRGCDSVASFDDRGFARRARKLGMTPTVVVIA